MWLAQLYSYIEVNLYTCNECLLVRLCWLISGVVELENSFITIYHVVSSVILLEMNLYACNICLLIRLYWLISGVVEIENSFISFHENLKQ